MPWHPFFIYQISALFAHSGKDDISPLFLFVHLKGQYHQTNDFHSTSQQIFKVLVVFARPHTFNIIEDFLAAES
jgi:hypothetical protein